MPERLHQNCREPGCRERTNDRSGYCAGHTRDNTALQRRVDYYHARDANDPIRKMYDATWDRFRNIFFNRNPICQKLQDGQQCRWPATLLHHLISPRQRPDLFLDLHNVVALCAHCHPPDEGTPDWVAGKDYVPSIIDPPMVA